MSFYYITYLSFKKNGDVNVRVADSSIRPLYYRTLHHLNLIEEKKTKEQYLKDFAVSVRNGNYHISGGSCKILAKINQATQILKKNSFGKLLKDDDYGSFVLAYIEDAPAAMGQWEAKKSYYLSPSYLEEALLEDAGRWNDLPKEIQQEEALCKYYTENCADLVFFTYPEKLLANKEYALKAVQAKGVNYRSLCHAWKNDKEVVFTAFSNPSWPEHLPDLIGDELLSDLEFLCSIIEAQPKLHWERLPRHLKENPLILDQLGKHNAWFQAKSRKIA